MRTQHAHYGCGTVFRVAVNTGVPTLEMLVVKDWQGQRERKRTETRMEESEGGREGIQETKEKKIDVLAWVDCNKDKEKCDEKYKGAKMGLRGGRKSLQRGACLTACHLPVHHQTIPTQEGDRTRNTNKWIEPPVKEKHKPQRHSTHTSIRILIHTLTHSFYEQSSCVQGNWARQHCLVNATNSITSATARHENTPTLRLLSLQFNYSFGDNRLF